MAHLGYFISIAGSLALNTTQLQRVRDFVKTNADAVWTNASAAPPFSQHDVCNLPGATRVKADVPKKFHWRWDWSARGDVSKLPLCMDARAHGSAVNLFLTDYHIAQLLSGRGSLHYP